MSETVVCTCCHHEISLDSLPVCDYCGFLNIATVGTMESTNQEALDYRRKLLSQVTNIAVESFEYGWNGEQYEKRSAKMLKIADGVQCDGKIVWAAREFGQWWDDHEKTVPVKIGFDAYGKRWTLKIRFSPVESASFWRIGVEITPDMKIVVYLGGSDRYAKSSGAEFLPLKKKV